jgi:hypothetical protein
MFESAMNFALGILPPFANELVKSRSEQLRDSCLNLDDRIAELDRVLVAVDSVKANAAYLSTKLSDSEAHVRLQISSYIQFIGDWVEGADSDTGS